MTPNPIALRELGKGHAAQRRVDRRYPLTHAMAQRQQVTLQLRNVRIMLGYLRYKRGIFAHRFNA